MLRSNQELMPQNSQINFGLLSIFAAFSAERPIHGVFQLFFIFKNTLFKHTNQSLMPNNHPITNPPLLKLQWVNKNAHGRENVH